MEQPEHLMEFVEPNKKMLEDLVNNAEYLQVDVIKGKFRVLESFVKKWRDNNKDVIVIDKLTGDKGLLTPFEFHMEGEYSEKTIKTYHGGTSRMVTYDWYGDSVLLDTEKSKWSEALLKRWHWTWFNMMQDYLTSNEFRSLNKKLNVDERKDKTVYPAKDQVYRSFSYRADTLRVVFVGYDPYLNNNANGIAFATDQPTKPVSLKQIEGAIQHELEYPLNFNLQNNLEHVIDQGVMFINSSFTGYKKAGYYADDWRPFTTKVLKTLNAFTKPMIFVFMGKNAQEYLHCIKPLKHSILQVEHPAAAAYQNRGWNSNNIFVDINKILVEMGTAAIQW